MVIDDEHIANSIPYYDREGRLIDRDRLDVLRKDRRYRLVASDQVGVILVSTMWMGLDFSFGRAARPQIFETIVFDADGAIDGERYASEEEAQAGHRRHVRERAMKTYGPS